MTTLAIDARKIADFGIGTYIRGLVAGLAELDQETHYVLFGAPDPEAPLDLPDNFRWIEERSPGYSVRELWRLSAAARTVRADLYHSPHYVLPMALPCPAVVTVHDLIHLRFPELRSPVERFYARFMMRRALTRSRRVIAVSDATATELAERFGARAENVVTIPNGVDARFFSELEPGEIAATLARLGLAPGYLLFVGNPKAHKNLPLLFEAHRRLGERRQEPPFLVVVGAESEPKTPRVPTRFVSAQVAARSPQQRLIGFLGKIAPADLPAVYRGALALVVPSLWEGFGLPAAEAMACGTPVVAANRGALPEVVGDAGILFEPEPEALVTALEAVLDSPTLRAELAVSGRARAARFTWSSSAKKTLEVYRQALETGRQRKPR